MADNLQATPRNELLGLLSDAMYGGLDWMKSPERTQQMQGLAGLLESTGIPQTTQRLAYGEPLTNIGRANVPLLKPETAEAAMTVAPFAPVAGRLASRAVRATESMPVGMSIKPINLNKGIYKPELTMEEMLKVKDIPTVERVRKSIDLVGEKEFEKMVNAQYKKYKPSDQDQEAMLVESVTLDILGRAQRSPYPQQAALDLAQQRAALPVSEGGLGLPANNTPMDRARAMGFGTEAYHGTNANVPVFDISKNITAKDIYSSPNPSEASAYATREGGNVMPLLLRGDVKDLTKESQYVDNQLRKAYNAQVSKYERQYYPFEQFKESFMRGQLYQDTGGQSAQNALVGELIGNRKSILKIPDAVSDFGVGESYVMQNPANIRSRFAAFDPFRKDVATATAMGVALPDLLAAEPTPQPQSSGLLYPFP